MKIIPTLKMCLSLATHSLRNFSIFSPNTYFCDFSARKLSNFLFFFFNDTATTEIYTLSLHDALPIIAHDLRVGPASVGQNDFDAVGLRSEEHTSELQSPCNLVCRLLLEKKKKKI